MANLPRILPIVFVAVGGVLAMKAITSLELVPQAFQTAEAFAAEQKAPAKKAEPQKAEPKLKVAAGESDNADDPTESFGMDPVLHAADAASAARPAATPAPICATSVDQLAKEAGMSANEINILQSLGTRRAQLDQREAQLNSRSQLIDAADSKLDARITQLQSLKTQIQDLINQASKTGDEDTVRMVKVYESMKPKDAAAVLTAMSDEVRLPIVAGMKDRSLAAILGAMSPDSARDLTEKMSKRMKAADNLQDKLNKATANGGVTKGAEASETAAKTPKKA